MTTPTCVGVYQDEQDFWNCGQGDFGTCTDPVKCHPVVTLTDLCKPGGELGDATAQLACNAHWIGGGTNFVFTHESGHDMPTSVCCATGTKCQHGAVVSGTPTRRVQGGP